MTSHRFVLFTVALGIGCSVGLSSAQAPVMRSVMQDKLRNTQALLQSVVAADFASIDRAASRLSRISETEIGSWQTPGQPEYTRQAMAFMSSVRGLREAARRRDADAVGKAYGALVSSCIECHVVVRKMKLVSATN